MTDENQATLATYDRPGAAELYFERTPTQLSAVQQQWLSDALTMIPPGTTILEIGSRTGRDAAWFEGRGYLVIRTEASVGLRDYQRSRGHEVRPLNVLTDELDEQFPLIHANAVLHHFTDDQLRLVLSRIRSWLTDDGIFTCSVKYGWGSLIESEKLGAPRFFRYWQQEELVVAFHEAGLKVVWSCVVGVDDTGQGEVLLTAKRDQLSDPRITR